MEGGQVPTASPARRRTAQYDAGLPRPKSHSAHHDLDPPGSATALWSDSAHLWDADYTATTTHLLTVSTNDGAGSATQSVTAGIGIKIT